MSDDRELSALLRDGMTAEARQVSASSAFTEQLIATALADPGPSAIDQRESRGWHAWVLPVAAAVLVALLVSSALIGGKLLHSSPAQPASSVGPLPLPSTAAPHSTAPKPAPSSSPSGSSSSGNTGPTGPVGGPVPAKFRAADLTWISADEGWALGTAPCASAPCTSIVRTTDGGQSWVGIPAPIAGLTQYADCPGTLACVGSLRFANALDGYAFGPNALFMTTDGGQTWLRKAGGAYGLEVAGGSAIRITSKCLPGCNFQVQRAAVGSDSWSAVALPSATQTFGARLARVGHEVALLTTGHVAGGAQGATSTVFTSTDDGASWTSRGEPCPQSGAELDSTAITIAGDGAIVLSCNSRMPPSVQFTVTSTDGGAHFSRSAASLTGADTYVTGAASASIQFAEAAGLYRSTDGGKHWTRVSGGPSRVSFIGFETAQLGRALDGTEFDTNGGEPGTSATIWTTTDAGQTWTSFTFK